MPLVSSTSAGPIGFVFALFGAFFEDFRRARASGAAAVEGEA
jgi:hypothetical protein